MDSVPGSWINEQISSWKRVADAVHAKGSFIYLQLCAADSKQLEREDPSFSYIPPRAQLSNKFRAPRALTIPEVHKYVQVYADAAANAAHHAGFNGVETHGANGYSIDQLLQDVSNVREDEYGDFVENRSRLELEVEDAVAKAICAREIYGNDAAYVALRHPDIVYIHVFEPRVNGK